MIGEVGVRERDDGLAADRHAERQVDVVVVAVPEVALLGQDGLGAIGRGDHRAEPALGPRAGIFLDQVGAAADQRALVVRLQIGEQIVLRVRMRRDLVALPHDLLGDPRIDLQRAGVGDEGGRHLVLTEYLQETPHPGAAAIGAPGHRGAVGRAGTERSGLHRERRPLPFGPVLEQAAQHNTDAGVVRPAKAARREFRQVSTPGWGGSRERGPSL